MDNAWAPGYSAGGSSSGTGVLVARGEVDLGVGGDQGGSIRLPASKNGIVGMKPTFGLVPYTGLASLEPTLDHTGPMTRTVLDNALFMEVLAGVDGIDDRQQAGCPFPNQVPRYSELAKKGVEGLRIGIIKESLDQPLGDSRVSDLVVKAASELMGLVATVEEVSIPMHKVGPELWAVVGRLSAGMTMTGKASGRRQLCLNDLTEKMAPLSQKGYDKMFPSTVNTLINCVYAWDKMPPSVSFVFPPFFATNLSLQLLGKATNLVRKLKDAYNEALDKYDVLITPTIPMLPQKLPRKDATVEEHMLNSAGLTGNTSPFNLVSLSILLLSMIWEWKKQ